MGLKLFSSQLQMCQDKSILCFLFLEMRATSLQGTFPHYLVPDSRETKDEKCNQVMAFMQRQQEASTSQSDTHASGSSELTFKEMNVFEKMFSSGEPTYSLILSLSALRVNATDVGSPYSSQVASVSSMC